MSTAPPYPTEEQDFGGYKAPETPGYQPPTTGYQPPPPNYQPAPANFSAYPGLPPSPQQQATNNVVVVQQQPTAPTTTVLRPVGDNYLTLSIVLTILCCVCTGLSSLICTLPAVFFAKQAREAEARGDEAGKRSNGRIAIFLNIGAVVWWIILMIILVVSIAFRVNANRCRIDYYDQYYC